MKIEQVAVDELKPHPQNYKTHPEEQTDHISKSIEQNGIYRNIVLSSDGYILAGHGVYETAIKNGIDKLPCARVGFDHKSTKALKILTGDNEVGRLADVDDRGLSDILKSVNDLDVDGLLGTGYNQHSLANLVMITRTADEVPTVQSAAEMMGLDLEEKHDPIKIIVSFRSEDDKREFAKTIGHKITDKTKELWYE